MLSGLIGNLGDESCCFFPLANLMLMLLTMGKEIFCLALWLLGDFFLVLIAVATGIFVFLFGVLLGIGGEVGHEVSEILEGQAESHGGHGGNGWGEAGDVAAVELGFLAVRGEEGDLIRRLFDKPTDEGGAVFEGGGGHAVAFGDDGVGMDEGFEEFVGGETVGDGGEFGALNPA